jgi:maleylpyruvate isomerase
MTAPEIDPRELDRHVKGCAAAHQRLLSHLDEVLTDELVARPSLLPGWTVGHTLAHLARNAESHIGLFEAAGRGEVGHQYPGGVGERADGIAAGAARSAAESIKDVRSAIWRLEQAWAMCDAEGWQGAGVSVVGSRMPIADLPFLRWREAEVHHADLGLEGFVTADWSSGYIREELRRQEMVYRSRFPMGIGSGLPEAALALEPHERLAWLLGRATPKGLDPVDFTL